MSWNGYYRIYILRYDTISICVCSQLKSIAARGSHSKYSVTRHAIFIFCH